MKPRTLLILLGLSLGIFAFIYFFERELPSTVEREEQSKQVLPLGADDVDALEITWGGKTVRLEKEPAPKKATSDEKNADEHGHPAAPTSEGVWKLVSPLSARADAGMVSNIVRRLAELRKDRTFDEFNAQETGLQNPRVEAKLRAEGREHRLAIGGDLPIGGATFVSDGQKAYQVGGIGDLVKELQKNPGDWRDKKLFHGERSEVVEIALQSPARKVKLVRQGEGENFDLVEPVKDQAERDLVSGLLSDIAGLEAATFLEPGASFTASGLVVEAKLATTPDDPFRIELGQMLEPGKIAAKVEDQLVALDATRLDPAFSREVNAWRSLSWSAVQVFQVDRAVFKTPVASTEVKRVDGEWKRGEDKLDFTVASDALYPLVEIKAQEILSRAEATARGFELGKPRLEVELETENKKEKLALFATQGDLAAATTEGRESVLLLPADKVAELEQKIEALRTAKPASDAPAAPTLPKPGEEPLEEEGEE